MSVNEPTSILILGGGGTMGPSLARLARRACDDAGVRHRVIAVSRFGSPGLAGALRAHGVEVIAGDLLDPRVLASLPEAPNVILMAGQKFGTTQDPAATWALNAYLPATVVRRFPQARLAVFSTGNVYPLVPASGGGARETDPAGPLGEYAQSALARERGIGLALLPGDDQPDPELARRSTLPAEALDRLRGHFRGEVRLAADLQQRRLGSDGAVFREVPPRLPHEPDRRAGSRSSAAGGEEGAGLSRQAAGPRRSLRGTS